MTDTKKWEQNAAIVLDSNPGVKRWAKNEYLVITTPYRHQALLSRYLPDFIAVTDGNENIIVEIK